MVKKLSFIIIIFIASVSFGETELNVDVFWGWGGCCRPMEWTPVEIGINSPTTEAFAGTVYISAPQDGLNTMNIQHSFVFTPELPLQIPLVTKLAFSAPKADVSILGERGIRWSSSFQLWDYSRQNPSITVVNEDDVLIGVVGLRKFGLNALPEQTISRSTREYGSVYVKDKLARSVPWDWTGFTALDLLILYDPDWSLFNKQQLNAITEWVSNGGRLLIILGNNRLMADNPLSSLLPFEIQPARQIKIKTDTLSTLNLNSQEDANSVCSTLIARPDVNYVQMVVNCEQGCLFAKGRIGFGRAAVLAFDPSILGDSQLSSSTRFWVNIIKSIIDEDNSIDAMMTAQGRTRTSDFVNSPINRTDTFSRTIMAKDDRTKGQLDNINSRISQMRYSPYYIIGTAQAGNNAIMEHLYHITQLRPLSIWWVILLLILFAVLLGPVDYIVLKRLDKLPLTWITCCCWIVVFSAGAYYGVAAIRGGSTTLRVISVLDGIEGLSSGWATYYSGLFAPNSSDYKFDNLSQRQWWSGLAPTEETLYGYNREVIGRNIFFEQSEGKNHPYSVPISIWTMQCLLAEWPIEKMPATAAVSVEGNKVTVKIDNKSDKPIISGYVFFSNNRAVRFGGTGTKKSNEFSGTLEGFEGWRTDNLGRSYRYSSSFESNYSFKNEDAFFAQGTLTRTKAINSMLKEGAAAVCLEYRDAEIPFKIRKRSYATDHIQLVRLIVKPIVQR